MKVSRGKAIEIRASALTAIVLLETLARRPGAVSEALDDGVCMTTKLAGLPSGAVSCGAPWSEAVGRRESAWGVETGSGVISAWLSGDGALISDMGDGALP